MKKRWWKWIVFPVVALVALVAVCWAIGAALPRTHLAARSAAYRRPLDAVWAKVADMEHSSSWRSDISGVRRLEDRHGHEVWLQLTKEGDWPLEIAESEPPRRMVAVVADSSQGYGGRWIYALAAEGEGTRLTITEDGFVDHPLFRFMARFIFGTTRAMDGYLKDLGKAFGETVTPAPATPVG